MKRVSLLWLLLSVFFISGCSVVLQKGRRSDITKIKSLEVELEELTDAKAILEERLAKEIDDKQVRLKMEEKGLVVTFVADVLFDSGKAVLKEEISSVLYKVIAILNEDLAENKIGIEGHTDNQPIKYSKWKSNWELSTHRALSVLNYLVKNGVDPVRVRAVGYGEYQPVASNDTPWGQQLNRRVEIVILPKTVKSLDKRSLAGESREGLDEEELK